MKKKRDWSEWRISKGIEHKNRRIFVEAINRELITISRFETPILCKFRESIPVFSGREMRLPFVLSE